MQSRFFLRLLFFFFFFSLFLLFSKKALAAPYAYFITPPQINLYVNQTWTNRVYASNAGNSINQVAIYYSPVGCVNCWTPMSDSGIGSFGSSLFYPASPLNWSWNTPGTYYVVTNVNGTLIGNRCTGNTNNGGANDLWGGVLSGWVGCDAGYASKPLMTVTVSPAPPASVIQITGLNANHNIYDICKTPNPNPDTMLLEELNVTTSVQNNGGEGFDSYYIYLTKLAGDSKPQNGIDNLAGWWKYGPIWLAGGTPITPQLFGNPNNANGFSGLVSGDRQARVVLYNSVQGCAACNGYLEAYDTWNYYIDRQPPNYNSDWPAPNSPPKSPKLRTTTPSSSDQYDPAGIVGMDITVEPSSPRADAGNFGLERFDLWVGALAGDNVSQIKAGNPACAPSPPYANVAWAPWGDLCKNSGPMSCPSYQPGAGVNGQVWYINYLMGASGGSINWDTYGFTPGTRVLSGNLFDNSNRDMQNFRTYTGIGISPYYARVDYNLMPPHAPNANFSPYPSGGIKNAIYGQPVSIPSAIANDTYGYLIKEEVAVSNQARSNSFSCPAPGWGGAPGNWWCYLANPSFTKRATNTINSFNWTPPNGVIDVYTVVINAFDQFGEKCSGDPNISGSPAWPPVWVNCGSQSRFTINANPPRTINVKVWNDYNQDGVQQLPLETGYSGATVVLSHTGDPDQTRTTDANGDYSFTSLIQGETYAVRMNGIANYKYTFPVSCTGLAAGSNCSISMVMGPADANANFGIVASYSISGAVFLDNNKNGIKDVSPPEQNYNTTNSTIRLASDALCQTPAPGFSDIVTSSGTYTFTNVYSGTYYVCYLGSPPPALPSGYIATNLRTVRVNITNASQTVNFGISNLIPWFQCIGLDCRNDNGFVDKIPGGASCGSYASLSGSGGTPGIIFTGDSNPDFGSGQASQNPDNWMAGGLEPPGYKELFMPVRSSVIRTSYNYMTTTANQNGITPTDLSTFCTLSNCTLPVNLANGAYLADGDLNLNAYTFPNSKDYVFLINGDLRIKGAIDVPAGSTATFSVKGNIIIDKDLIGVAYNSLVTGVEGFYSADGSFTIDGYGASACGTPSEDKRLNIGGAVVVNADLSGGGSFMNNRDICGDDINCPAYSLIERPDFILNAPEFIKHPNFLWQEVAP